MIDDPNGTRRFCRFLSQACRGARKLANERGLRVSQEDVAKAAGVNRSAIARFELEAPWPRDPDKLVAAYASLTGIGDSRELWEKGLVLWCEMGLDYLLPGADVKPEEFSSALDEWLQQHPIADEDDEELDERTASGRGD